jgi:hypothetical protein
MHRPIAIAVVITCVLLACAHVDAQPAKIVRIGFLGPTSAASNARRMDALREGLRDLGYVEGHNLVIEARWADGEFDRLPALATELVRLNVDIILTAGTPGIRAAKHATTTIPIVMVTSGDPVAFGFVASLARAGGNITGSSNFSSELSAKHLELLKEAFPDTQHVGVVFNPDNAVNDRNLPVMEQMSTEEKAALAREAGADEAIFYTRQDVETEVKRRTNGQGVNVLYDAVGKTTFEKSLNCLKPLGYLVLYGQSSGPVAPCDPAILSAKGSLFLTRPSLFHYIADRASLEKRAGDVLGWIASGKLKMRIEFTFPLASVAEAHRSLEGRKTTGKVLLIP